MESRRKTILITAVVTFMLTAALFVCVEFVRMERFWKLNSAAELLNRHYYKEIDRKKMTDGAVAGMAASLDDPYTGFLSEADLESLSTMMDSSYVGVGVEVYVDINNLMTVLAPFDESPAEKAGLLPGDHIIKIDEMEVSGDNYMEAVDYLKGKTGADDAMEVVVLRGEKILNLNVVRGLVELKTVKTTDYGDMKYIRISNFSRTTPEEFRAALDGMGENVRGVALDLRNNPGGILESAAAVCDMLLPEGIVVYTETKQGRGTEKRSDASQLDKPLAVLINGASASASEIVAGAVKDFGKGRLVGTRSFGKGLVQEVFMLDRSTAMRVTTARYFTPKGICIQDVGIEPDVVVELPEELNNKPLSQISYQEDTQLHEALAILHQ